MLSSSFSISSRQLLIFALQSFIFSEPKKRRGTCFEQGRISALVTIIPIIAFLCRFCLGTPSPSLRPAKTNLCTYRFEVDRLCTNVVVLLLCCSCTTTCMIPSDVIGCFLLSSTHNTRPNSYSPTIFISFHRRKQKTCRVIKTPTKQSRGYATIWYQERRDTPRRCV